MIDDSLISLPAWFQEHGAGLQGGGTAGRSWYTSLGHTNETWQVRLSDVPTPHAEDARDIPFARTHSINRMLWVVSLGPYNLARREQPTLVPS